MDLGLGRSGQCQVFRLRVSHLSWHRLSSVCVDVHQGGSEPPHPHPLAGCTIRLLTTLVLLPCGSVGATRADMGVLGTALAACLWFSVPDLSEKHQLGLW